MTCNTQKPMARQLGAVLVEMVLVTPILVFLVLATGDLTRAFIEHNTLTKSVRNGARYVAANAYEGTRGIVNVTATLENETKNLVVYGSISPAAGAPPVLPGLTLTDIDVVHIAGSFVVEVSATYTIGGLFGPLLPPILFGGPGISTTRDLRAAVTMRAL
jgi:hypothetical protein